MKTIQISQSEYDNLSLKMKLSNDTIYVIPRPTLDFHLDTKYNIRTTCSHCGASLSIDYMAKEIGVVKCKYCRSLNNIYV